MRFRLFKRNPQNRNSFIKILILPRYTILGASSRLRFFQFIPALEENHFKVTVRPLLNDFYLDRIYSRKRIPYLRIVLSYIKRAFILLGCKKYDILLIEKELFPWCPSWAEQMLSFFKIPYVVDFDDAIFHNYDLNRRKIVRYFLGENIKTIMKYSRLVIAGNEYIAQYAKDSGSMHTEIIPTVVDLNKYYVTQNIPQKVFRIGWIGSPSTVKFLQIVKPIISQFCIEHPTLVVLVGSGPISLGDVPMEVRSWSESTEVADIQSFDIGIMPLFDEPWEKGKCGYKLIQYMACGIPVISSPVGINTKIVDDGVDGYLAGNSEEWMSAFKILYDRPQLRKKLGESGRKKIESLYSLQVTSPFFVKLIRESCSSSNIIKKIN
jgi:glycosyltransferase involved in cell wall biosynthesis